MNLVLVAIHIEESPRAVPLGPALLASSLKRAFPSEVHVDLLDLYLGQPAAQCAAAILALRPRAVGLSVYLWNRALALEIAEMLKRKEPDLPVFAGGPEATADGDRLLEEGCLDFVLPGEGEESIVRALEGLLRGLDPVEIRELMGPSPEVDLAVAPSPFLDGTLEIARYTGLLWELSRGCPFRCDFCFESRGTAGVRRIPLDRVVAELRLFEASGVAQVFVLDPTFNCDEERAKHILRLIREHAPGVHFFFEIRSEFVDEEMAELFASVRCSLQIGLQSADDEVLRLIHRRIDREEFEEKILLLHEAGVIYGFDVIYGLPGDTLEGFLASLDFALGLVPNHLDLFRLAVLPGTRLFDTAASFGLEFQPSAPYDVISSPSFPRAELETAASVARAADLFYNRGRAVPWFGMLLDALGLPASELFREFAAYLGGADCEDVTGLQREFVLSAFARRGRAAVGRIAADVVAYFGISEEVRAQASGSRLASFFHDPIELLGHLEAGFTDLDELALLLPERPCEAALYLRDEEVGLEVRDTQSVVVRPSTRP